MKYIPMLRCEKMTLCRDVVIMYHKYTCGRKDDVVIMYHNKYTCGRKDDVM